MKVLSKLEKSREFWFLLITSVAFFLLRLPSLFEPNWYGDEGVYQVLGLGLNHGRLLYQGIWDNKPPLLYLIYAFSHSDQFLVRLIACIFGLLSIFCLFFLARELFFQQTENPTKKQRTTVFLVTGLFAFLFGIPLIEGNIANAENFMLLPIIAAAYIVFSKNRELKNSSYYLSFFVPGLLLGIAFLFKIVAIFDFAAFAGFIFIIHFGLKKMKHLLEMLIFFSAGFALPLVVAILFFFAKGALSDFIHAALIQNVGYVGYGNSFIIPQGLLILKALVLGAFVLFLFSKRAKINPRILFVLIWFVFSLFNAFFSGRPYTHYVLVMLPAFCLMVGLVFFEQKIRTVLVVALAAALLLLVKNFTYFGKTFLYYQNYVLFLTNNESVYDYRIFFDRNTPRDYELADYLKNRIGPADNVFIWGNNAQVYVLIGKLPPGRYTVAYHMSASKASLEETGRDIKRVNPKFIVINEKEPFPFTFFGYKQKMTIDSTSVYERSF